MQIRAIITVHGNVQGVGYRRFAEGVARDMQITGFVRNMPDETVRIVAELDESKLDDFINRLKAHAHFGKRTVSDIDIRKEKAKGEFDDFFIFREDRKR